MKIGDKIIRLLAGKIPMELTVAGINEDSFEATNEVIASTESEGWTFCRKTGAEIDHYLKWGPQYGKTGSFIKDFKPF